MPPEILFDIRCAGGNCPVKETCEMFLRPKEHTRNYLRIPYKRIPGGVQCGSYKKGTHQSIMAEMARLKSEL